MMRRNLRSIAGLLLLVSAAGYVQAQTGSDGGRGAQHTSEGTPTLSLSKLPPPPAAWYLNSNAIIGPKGRGDVTPAAAGKVKGMGTKGKIPLWLDAMNIGDSSISQTASGISVVGIIQTSGGIKFADGSLLTTAPSGGGGGSGLSFPFTGVGATAVTLFRLVNTGSGVTISAEADSGQGLVGISISGFGVGGLSGSGHGVKGVSKGGNGVDGTSETGIGLNGFSISGNGAEATSQNGFGVRGVSLSSDGVHGESNSGNGVVGTSVAAEKAGVAGNNTAGGYGVFGLASSDMKSGVGGANTGAGQGVAGSSSSGIGVLGLSAGQAAGDVLQPAGVYGSSANFNGVMGTVSGANTVGVWGIDRSGNSGSRGVRGESNGGIGIEGIGLNGVVAVGSNNFAGLFASNTLTSSGCTGCHGVSGVSRFGVGVRGEALDSTGIAGFFKGDVQITGNLSKGGGSFKIDHPLDPENKYLYHSFVESPDMMNIYNGNITTDENGDAIITLPDYFEALNRDFRYQLTVIGTFAQAIIASKVKDNHFTIKTNSPRVEVSWQVTGVRKDPYAEKHRIPVEEAKQERERGYYLHPEAYGQTKERGIEWAREPEFMREIRKALIDSGISPKSLPPPGSGGLLRPSGQ
jgi:hypothetical protein